MESPQAPLYTALAGIDTRKISEDQASATCPTHGLSQTPHLDAYLRNPSVKARVHEFISALDNGVDGDSCTKCAAQGPIQALTVCLRELGAAWKNGQWSSEEKKVLKAEAKGLLKKLKRDIKGLKRDMKKA